MSEQDLKEQIGEMAYYVTQQNGTEPPFTGKYDRFFEKGIYDIYEKDKTRRPFLL